MRQCLGEVEENRHARHATATVAEERYDNKLQVETEAFRRVSVLRGVAKPPEALFAHLERPWRSCAQERMLRMYGDDT